MNIPVRVIFAGLVAVLVVQTSATGAPMQRPTSTQALVTGKPSDLPLRERLNAWTVGLAGGLLEGAPIRFATEIARVVDDGDNLHVLPIVTRGPAENIEALLYLKGVDAAIINADALQQFRAIVPNIQQRITYILNLFPSELHVFVRPEIGSLKDLAGKKVNFNTPGTAAAYSGPLIFDHLKLEVEKTFIPHQLALEQMRKGDMAAVVFVTSKPIDAFVRGKWEPGFKFLPIEADEAEGLEFYLPSTLTSQEYPQLIAPGEKVQTIAVPTILAAFNWQKGTARYQRVARLTEYLFNRVEKLQEPGFHPAWKGANPDAEVPGLNRFPAAQEWIDQRLRQTEQFTSASGGIDPNWVRTQIRRAAPNNSVTQDRWFREFMEWRRQRRR